MLLTASAQGGTSAFGFMNLPYSARMCALGGSNVSLREGDLGAAMCNPALLTAGTHNMLQLNYAYYGAGQNFASVQYGYNFGALTNKVTQKQQRDMRSGSQLYGEDMTQAAMERPNLFAAGIHYMDYGKFFYADEYGNMQDITFGARDILIDVMYARQLGPMFSVGAALKPVLSFYESYNSFALGADVGGHFTLPDKGLDIGLSLQNIGWQLKGFYSDENGQALEMLPLNLQMGLNYTLPHAPIRFSLTAHNMQRWNLNYQTSNIGSRDGDQIVYHSSSNIPWYDMLFRHTIWAVDVVPKSGKFWVTLAYNHRRRMELKLVDKGTGADQKSLAGLSLGAGLNIKGFRVAVATTQYTKSNYMLQMSLSVDINTLLK